MAAEKPYIHCRSDKKTKRKLAELSEFEGLNDTAYLKMTIAKNHRTMKQREYRATLKDNE